MTYHLRLKYHGTGNVAEYAYETALERALAIIGTANVADVLRTWEEPR